MCNISFTFAILITVYIILSILFGFFSVRKYIKMDPTISYFKIFFIIIINSILMPLAIIHLLYLMDKYDYMEIPLRYKEDKILRILIKILYYLP